MATLDKKPTVPQQPSPTAQFEQEANQPQIGVTADLIDFLLHNKKWWLTPIVIAILALGLLVIAAGSGAAPFIYTLF